ncbi:DUF397 domain-containing protein [Streptomyces rubiginosohelvolus]|uniref:DUF397 domain-containing protein n=1 Tax=Streptomyces rubiginosohelvolus TaxID=67362 RepID=UPI0035DEFA7F
MDIAINDKTQTLALDVAPETEWYKSSYSNDTGGSCVEIAPLPEQVGIRDSKDKQGPALVVPQAAWTAFLSLATASSDAR